MKLLTGSINTLPVWSPYILDTPPVVLNSRIALLVACSKRAVPLYTVKCSLGFTVPTPTFDVCMMCIPSASVPLLTPPITVPCMEWVESLNPLTYPP